ncbi:hypothetical protein RF11_09968 [Thelohanellus kitauei]|uniref:Uncharacterized protein n=1 Tax=Thelohanellus kitauei TaxID=669202 RepID=A0A0C2N330_THEKT|nr:hypothetical protein RF11_09968 [Thelohanellus kitauei]
MHSIEIFLCFIAIAQISHSDPNADLPVLPLKTKPSTITFPLLEDYKMTISGLWAVRISKIGWPMLFTNEQVVSVAYGLDISSIRLVIEDDGNEVWIQMVVRQDSNKFYFSQVQIIYKDNTGSEYYYDHEHSYELEKKEEIYEITYEDFYTRNRNLFSCTCEIKDVLVNVTRAGGSLFAFKK